LNLEKYPAPSPISFKEPALITQKTAAGLAALALGYELYLNYTEQGTTLNYVVDGVGFAAAAYLFFKS
jgi:hypothetical protein